MGPPSKSFRAHGVSLRASQSREPAGLVLGGQMNSITILPGLFGGWLKTADKGAAAIINYAKLTVLLAACDLTRKPSLATGKTLVELGYTLADCCANK